MKGKSKQILILIVSAVFVYFIFKNRGEIGQVASALTDTHLRWLALAILGQLFSYYFIVLAHKESLEAVGLKRTEKELLPLVLAALVINTSAPTGGASGTLLFVEDAKKRKEPALAAAGGIILLIICYYLALLSILIFILFSLYFRRELGPTEVISTVILLGFTLFYISLLLLARFKPDTLQKLLEKANRLIYRVKKLFTKKAKLSKLWAKNTACELIDASVSITKSPTKMAKVILAHFVTHAFNILTLLFIFISFGETTKFGVIIVGYSIGELFKIVSPAPEGVGVTEASMALIYTSFGINPVEATAIALVYRGLNFWIPLLIGFVILQAKHLRPSDFKKEISLD